MTNPFDDSMERLVDPAMLRTPGGPHDAAAAPEGRTDISDGDRTSAFDLADTDPQMRPVDEFGLPVDPADPGRWSSSGT